MKLKNGVMFSDKALALLLEFEGFDQPGHWPGVDSGVSIGIGYDLGYTTRARFLADWGGRLPAGHVEALSLCVGVKGQAAARLARNLKAITIPRAVGRAVFLERTLPDVEAETRAVFPGVERLPQDAQDALVSLVYNRGGKLVGDTRLEMRSIRALVPGGNLRAIAAEVRKMKRLWPKYLGLRRRRDAEAALIEYAAGATPASPPYKPALGRKPPEDWV